MVHLRDALGGVRGYSFFRVGNVPTGRKGGGNVAPDLRARVGQGGGGADAHGGRAQPPRGPLGKGGTFREGLQLERGSAPGEGPLGRGDRTARGHARPRHDVRRGAVQVRVRASGIAVAARVLGWTGPEGGTIAVGFDDAHFGSEQMMVEIAFADEAHPNLPDEVPEGTRLTFATER